MTPASEISIERQSAVEARLGGGVGDDERELGDLGWRLAVRLVLPEAIRGEREPFDEGRELRRVDGARPTRDHDPRRADRRREMPPLTGGAPPRLEVEPRLVAETDDRERLTARTLERQHVRLPLPAAKARARRSRV